jgi:predicted ATPase/class 3 adenylate cyclase
MAVSPRPAVPDAATGTLTFLFTDLVGSTRLWEEHPDAMKAALKRHDAIIRQAVESAGGQVVKTTGDGLMAVFETAAAGVTAGLSAQLGLEREPWAETGPLRVRMGLHAGEVERRADDFFGPTVNRTARIMAAGHGGQVLLSAAAAALATDRLPPGTALRDLGEHRLKDLGRPERVFQLEHAGLELVFPPLVTPTAGASTLPAADPTFVGRVQERAAIGRRLADDTVRILTLTGPAGSGKTSLAIQVAGELVDRFLDGLFFVDLAATRDAESLLVAVARTLGVSESVDRPLIEALHDRLRDRRTLVVLDNVEQVVGGAGAVVDLLGECAGLTLLVTSREPLRVRAEQVVSVPPLALPASAGAGMTAAELGRYEAVALFVERARAVRPGFELTDTNAAAVVDICRRLDGLPLAIELAAARLRLLSPDALRDRLGSRLDLLRSETADLPVRQQTLRAAIDWSYQLLDPAEQRLFESLAAFADADVAAVEAVSAAAEAASPDGRAGARLDPIEGLASLLDKSLIRHVDTASAEPRFTMLETIREFATERLEADPSLRDRVAAAHATYFADLAARQRQALVGSGRDRALATLADEAPNLRLAWRHWLAATDLEQLDRLAEAILVLDDARGWYLESVGLTTDLLGVLATTTSTPERVSQEIRLRMTLARALMATKGYTPEVEEAYGRALDLFEVARANEGGEALLRQRYAVLRGLASVYLLRTEFDKAHELGRRILDLADRLADRPMRIDGQLVVGSTLIFTGRVAEGMEQLEAAIDAAGSLPARSHVPYGNDPRVACLTTSALALWMLGYPDRAVERADRAIALAGELGHPFTSAFAWFHAALVHLFRGEPDLVLERSLAALAIAGEHDFAVWDAVGRCVLGAAKVALGRSDEGLAEIRTGLDLYQGRRTPPVFWPTLLMVSAGADLVAGRWADGLSHIDAAIPLLESGPGALLLPEVYLIRGDLLAGLDGTAGPGSDLPTAWYRKALDGAAALGLRMSELRAATRLCRAATVARADGHDGQADRPADAARLRAILATFDEGFETADLRAAAQLIEERPAG